VSANPYLIRESASLLPLNAGLLAGYHRHEENPDIVRTHLFNGRYENVYLKPEHVPELARVLEQATRHAASILGVSGLRVGSWFNYMPPGAFTTLHRHDDDDELLSGVYYVHVPQNSGRLVIHHDGQQHAVEPREGRFVFFGPEIEHEVTVNAADSARLSIGMNFGIPTDEEDN
jgi:hypothetical protein